MSEDKEFLDFAKENLKVLYVEDNEDARFLTTLLLEEYFKEVVTAKDAQEALEKFKNGNFDVVISDINMPGMSGIELLEKIKQIDNDVFVVLLSAHSDAKFIIDAIELGVDGYLLKPLDIQKLQKLVVRIAKKYYYLMKAKKYENYLKAYEDATNSAFLVSRTDPTGKITYANKLFCEKSKYTLDEILGKPHNIVRHPRNPKSLYEKMWKTIKEEKKPFKTIIRNRAKDGSSYYVNALMYPILNEKGEIEEFLSIRVDISDVMNQKAQLEFEISQLKDCKKVSLIYIKLSQYEFLERLYKKEYIEAIEKEVFIFLKERFEKSFEFERFYYLGDGEYAFVTPGERKRWFLKSLREIQDEINNSKIEVKDISFDVEIKIVVSFEKDRLLESAKYGMRLLEKKHRSFFVTSSLMKRLEEEAKKRFEILKKITKALESKDFVSYFQPIVDNSSSKIVKFESLIRLKEKDRVLSPFFFLDVAKESRYYFDISKIVMEEAFEKAKRYNQAISVNISILDLQKPIMKKFILELIEKYEDIANLITFEILEDYDVENIGIIKLFLKKVRDKGVSIAIDDFGSGYANFKRIMEYEPDTIKIDGSLIKNILSDSLSESVVQSIVKFAKLQNLKVVAEFVEDEKIYKKLIDLGVDYSQGYYFGPPKPIEEYLK